MTTSAKPRRARGAAVSWAVAVSLVVGCSGGDDSASVSTTEATHTATNPTTTEPAPTSTTTTTVPGPEGEVLAAVDGYWRTIRAAGDPPDPGHPDLERYATGDALRVATRELREKSQLGHGARLPEQSQYSHELSVISLDGATSVVRDCQVDDVVVYQMATGAVLNDAVVTNLWEIRLAQETGVWKVAELEVEQSWEGVAGCAAG